MGTYPHLSALSPQGQSATEGSSSLTCPLVTAWGCSRRLFRASWIGVSLWIAPGRNLSLGYRRSLKRLDPYSQLYFLISFCFFLTIACVLLSSVFECIHVSPCTSRDADISQELWCIAHLEKETLIFWEVCCS